MGNWITDLIIAAAETFPGNRDMAQFYQGLKEQLCIKQSVPMLDPEVLIHKLAAIIAQVCRIDITTDEKGATPLVGTGFLVSSDMVLTNYHVVEALILGEQGKKTQHGFSAHVDNVTCRFDYKRLPGNQVSFGTVYPLASSWQIASSPNYPPEQEPPDDCLDYALFRLAHSVGNDPIDEVSMRGWISIPSAQEASPLIRNMPLFIMHYPKGDILKLLPDAESVLGTE